MRLFNAKIINRIKNIDNFSLLYFNRLVLYTHEQLIAVI